MKSYSILICFLFVTVANNFSTVKAQVDVNDSLALVDLYNSTNGPEWFSHENWLTTNPVSTWFGITVKDARATRIDLGYFNNLSGFIPASIGNLDHLHYLNVTGNYELNGAIPASIGNLVQLVTLNLSDNQLSGAIPSSIGNLVRLKYLYLSNNQLRGSIPSSIGNLANLRTLYLSFNILSGEIPSSIGNLLNLSYLELGDDNLSGEIPSSIGNLVNLQTLSLASNHLSGSIPSSIGNLASLRYIYLNNNQLSGSIPASIGNLANLSGVHLNNNQLSGEIPSSIGNLLNLTGLDLSHNHLRGKIPSSIGNIVNLIYLDLSHNQLRGEIPYSSKKLKQLTYVNISYNQLLQSNNVEYLSGSMNKSGSINNNLFNFNGVEFVAQKFPNVIYAPQALIHVHQNGNVLSVSAGGTLSNNTYKWFRVGSTEGTTITGDSAFQPKESGKYYAQVTNSIATQLTLYSDTINYTISSIKESNNIIATKLNSLNNLVKQMQVFPNPASSMVNIQLNGTAAIVLTNEDGKVILTKTVTNNATINVGHFAPGIYYVQNKANGEVKQVVIVH